MSKKLTEKSLEKKLHNMGTEELIQIIMSLYRSNKSVEQSINLQIIGDAYHDAIVAAGHRMKNYINYGRTGWKVFYMILQASAGGWLNTLDGTPQSLISVSNRKNAKKPLRSLAGKVGSMQTPITIWQRTFTPSQPPTWPQSKRWNVCGTRCAHKT